MTQHALCVGPCHYQTGRERYRVKSAVPIRWERREWDKPLALPFYGHRIDPNSDSSSDSDVSDDNDGQGVESGREDQDSQDPEEFAFELMMTDEPEFDLGPEDHDGDAQTVEWSLHDSDGADESGVPGISPWRLNLTALSQRYNMYVAAYKNEIHISRVRNCVDHTLPPRPDILLRPEASVQGLKTPGYINRRSPHEVNHLVMGDLGNEEILLLAYDDGDIVAYYNGQIESQLLHLRSGDTLDGSTLIKPFFHQNVGISAWGLAVHTKSRLIAVSNNNHEVHIFVFALTSSSPTSTEVRVHPAPGGILFPIIRKSAEGRLLELSDVFKSDASFEVEDLKYHLLYQRKHNCRLILETGRLGNNMPNVAFGNDVDGNAVKAIAIDITGQLWVLDMWECVNNLEYCVLGLHESYRRKVTRRGVLPRRRIDPPRGWGVLVLPESSFLPTDTFRDSLGLTPAQASYVCHPGYGYYIDTLQARNCIKNNSIFHPWIKQQKLHQYTLAPPWVGNSPGAPWWDAEIDRDGEWNKTQDEAADKSLDQIPPSIIKTEEENNIKYYPADGSSIMRTYEVDVELMGCNVSNVGIMSTDITNQKRPPGARLPYAIFSPERLANLLHVPELCLVVAGSLCGRVALITLTRPSNPDYSFSRGFKTEAILPTREDEERNLRPSCCLLGVAIGPIPSTTGVDPPGGRRYRIMLHYYDHRILSYEVYRDTSSGELSLN